MEININSKTLGKVQCVFILSTKKFFIRDISDNNDNTTKTSHSNKKQKIKEK